MRERERETERDRETERENKGEIAVCSIKITHLNQRVEGCEGGGGGGGVGVGRTVNVLLV